MIPQFNIQFDIPSEVSNGFPQMLNKVRKHIVRESIRSALTPARARLKSYVMSMTRQAEYGSGATYRSLTAKYRQAKHNPNRFYGYIGVNRKYLEAILPEKPVQFGGISKYRQVSFGIRRRNPKPGENPFQKRWQRKEVRSMYRGYTYKPKRRKPSKYLHLIEFGFQHRGGNRFPGYGFVQQAVNDSRAEAQAIFKAKILEHFKRAFK